MVLQAYSVAEASNNQPKTVSKDELDSFIVTLHIKGGFTVYTCPT